MQVHETRRDSGHNHWKIFDGYMAGSTRLIATPAMLEAGNARLRTYAKPFAIYGGSKAPETGIVALPKVTDMHQPQKVKIEERQLSLT